MLPGDAYGGTFRLFDRVEKRWGVEHSPAELSDVDAVAAAIRPGQTKIVWVETPTNPLLGIADIEALAGLAHDAGALLVVDNTFASPYLQRPLTLGADVVVHSTTKYAGGHSDVVGGALVVRDLELAEKVGYHQNAMGAVAGPFDSWLVLRGLKTLAIRMDRHCDNAEQVVEFLGQPPGGHAGLLPGSRVAPRARGRGPADEPVRRDGVLPGLRRRAAGARGVRAGRGLHARGVARRHRVAHRASRPDDPRERGRDRARGARPTWCGSASASRPSTT